MSQFVLYIEPLLRTLHSKLSGIGVGTRTLTCIGYADDVTCIVRSEDDVAQINDTLSAFTHAATAHINSAKTKLLDLKPEPPAQRQVSPYVQTDKLRTLGIEFMENSEQIIKCNWDSVVHKVRGNLVTARLRNINIIQRAYIVNTYILSQLWYVEHLFPMPKATESQIRQKLSYNNSRLKTAKSRRFIAQYGQMITFSLDITYRHFKARNKLSFNYRPATVNVVPRVQLRCANLHWDTIWKNIADVEIPTALRATAYSFVNDLTPTKIRHKSIFLDADDRCVICDHRDTALYRVTSCIYSRPLRTWCRRRIARRLDVAVDDIREETLCFLDLTAFPTVKRRAVVWLLMNLIDFTVNTLTPFHLYEIVDRLCRA
ncbi:hypothetical protein PR048_009240, partial [Dryococelus australis]